MHEVEVTAEEKEKLKAEKNENSNDAHDAYSHTLPDTQWKRTDTTSTAFRVKPCNKFAHM